MLALCVSLLFAQVDSPIGESLDLAAVLQEIQLRSESTLPYRVRMRYVENWPEGELSVERDIVLFKDGVRIDRRETAKRWSGSGDRKLLNEQFVQEIWDAERYLVASTIAPDSPDAEQWLGGTSQRATFRSRLNAMNTDAELNGVFPGDTKPYHEIVASSKDSSVRSDSSTIAGVDCLVIEADTPRGHYVVLVDPKTDYLVRKATVTRESEDLAWDDVPLGKQENTPLVKMKFDLDNAQIELRDGHYVVLAARTQIKRDYLLSGPGGVASSSIQTEITIENIEFSPDFSKSKAFVLAAPDGTSMTDFDSRDRLVWSGGKLAP